MSVNPKQQRQRLIREIIGEGGIHTQEDLAERLRERGTTATQATVSRDLVELGAVRVSLPGQGLVYALPEAMNTVQVEAARRRLRLVLSEVPAELGVASTILVFRTSPGIANNVAVTLDACAFPEIVGTVAGDDTIFIALRSPDDRHAVEAILMNGEVPDGL
jgi:transcriptional regulator of arginine metabolism